jgi:hypothetical protein
MLFRMEIALVPIPNVVPAGTPERFDATVGSVVSHVDAPTTTALPVDPGEMPLME